MDINKYYDDLMEKINIFCNKVPNSGFEIEYLEKCKKIYELYAEANEILEDEESEETDRLDEILNEIKGIVEKK